MRVGAGRRNSPPRPGANLSLQPTRRCSHAKGPRQGGEWNEPATLLLLGAGLDADNLGLCALAAGTVTLWLQARTDGAVTLLDYAHAPKVGRLLHWGTEVPVHTVPMRFSWRMHLPNTIVRLLWTAVWTRLLPRKLCARVQRRNACLRAIHEADVVAALSGGDSFSDVYGLGRFLYVLLPQVLVLWAGKPLLLLPQTYGPYRTRLTGWLAAYVLRRAERVYSRDPNGVDAVKALAGDTADRVRFAHDLGFALAPRPPSAERLKWLDSLKRPGPLVGLNVSGLLYAGGYTRRNMFGLAVDYPKLVLEVLCRLLAEESCRVVLVPHVFGESLEADPPACARVWEQVPAGLRNRVHLAEGRWTAGEIKHLIGQCDFFVGSRMHACIAALSQAVPAAGLAYSPKFAGVFESVGTGNLVFNLDTASREQVVRGVADAFRMRKEYAERLRTVLPEIQAGWQAIFGQGDSTPQCAGGV